MGRRELTQALIEQWVALTTGGQFSLRDIHYELGIETSEGKHHLRTIMSRLTEKGLVQAVGRDGAYRKLDDTKKKVAWQEADLDNTVDLRFPFGLEQYVKIYPKSIIVVAGTKNAGKSAFMYNFVYLNMGKFGVDLFNSETGPEQLKERFECFNIPNPAPFEVYERYDNFADVVDSNRISVIDYMDFNSEVYLVGDEIDRIFQKLVNGVAVVGLQKPPPATTIVKGVKKTIERDLGYGGAFSAKRAVLYISMSDNKLKLVYVKTPKQRNLNPNNMQWAFSMDENGTTFRNIQRYYGEEEEY